MTTTIDILDDGFGRIRDTLARALGDIEPALLTARVDPEANTIAWLAWHLTRVQDDHIAEVAGTEQVYTAAGWAERLDLPFAPDATGYAQSAADVARVAGPGVTAENLLGYHDAVLRATRAYLSTLDDAALDRVVDENWNPPVTLAVRLVSVLSDDLQHAGQAAYVRGVLERSS